MVTKNIAIFCLLAAAGACKPPPAAGDGAAAPGAGGPARPPDCPNAPSIYRYDAHINMAFESVTKTLMLNERWNVRGSINVMGGFPGYGLEESAAILKGTGGRIRFMCNVDWSVFGKDYFVKKVTADLQACKEKGAVGLKIFKSLGLGVEWPDGRLLKVDDPALDPIFEKAGELGLPVLIHSGDPKAFFKPPDKDNERIDELMAHPAWSFYGEGIPSWEEVFAQYSNRVARHPKTIFIGSHFGNDPEDPPAVFAMMEKNPNLYIVTSARIPEIGRFDAQKMHDYFLAFQDRIIYGSDLGVGPDTLMLGSTPPRFPDESQIKLFFTASYRYFETWEKQFDHPTPIQGRWKIDGIGLPCGVLEKVYHANAERLFHLQ